MTSAKPGLCSGCGLPVGVGVLEVHAVLGPSGTFHQACYPQALERYQEGLAGAPVRKEGVGASTSGGEAGTHGRGSQAVLEA